MYEFAEVKVGGRNELNFRYMNDLCLMISRDQVRKAFPADRCYWVETYRSIRENPDTYLDRVAMNIDMCA